MHLAIGFLRVMLACVLAWAYGVTGSRWFGRRAIRLCCAAWFAGSGIDDGATDVILRMGQPGRVLLEGEAARRGEHSNEAFVVGILRESGTL